MYIYNCYWKVIFIERVNYVLNQDFFFQMH